MSPLQGLQSRLLEPWKRFIRLGEAEAQVSPLIAASWKRCWARINPMQPVKPVRLNPGHLLSTQVAGFELISVARPIMEDVYQCIERTGAAIMLINPAGCMIDRLGDADILTWLDRHDLTPGAFLSEELLGTNAVGLALAERVPVQVVGAEHYLQQLHKLAGAAAPIFDLSGRLLGALAIFMLVKNYHSHSLGLAAAGARAVEGQRQADLMMAEQNIQLAQLNTILSTISEGILVWNAEMTLLHANRAACAMLGAPEKALVGRSVAAALELPAFIHEAAVAGKPLTNVEATLGLHGRSFTGLVSLECVHNKGALQWVILTVRTEKQVHDLVTQQIGAGAALTIEDIPGESPQMQRMRTFIRTAARARAGVLIRGETGVGKNALANAIHNGSPNHDGPFVTFACASIPSELALTELLGYDEQFDGRRMRARPSKFELARGGTLYFQDIDALPLEAQAALLNAIEARIIQRLGSRRPIEIDVRVVASSTASFEALIAQGSFRPDLYYRLSTFLITIPPLRERPGDIPLVVERILKRLAAQLNLPSLELAPGVMDLLRHYAWYGNVREVEALLGRAVAQLGDGVEITADLLPQAVRSAARLPPGGEGSAIRPLVEIERQAILQTAQLCHGNVTRMAQSLEMSRTTLWRRLREFGIRPEDFRPRGEEIVTG